MAEYNMEYMQEHCIDIYFRYGGCSFHVLTYGTIIPAPLNNVDQNRSIQHYVAIDMDEMRDAHEVHIEQDYITAVRESFGEYAGYAQLIPNEDTVLQMFKPVAQLGFYSYDCVEELEGGRGLYRLVAYPGEGVEARAYDNMPNFDGIEVIERDEERDLIICFRM